MLKAEGFIASRCAPRRVIAVSMRLRAFPLPMPPHRRQVRSPGAALKKSCEVLKL